MVDIQTKDVGAQDGVLKTRVGMVGSGSVPCGLISVSLLVILVHFDRLLNFTKLYRDCGHVAKIQPEMAGDGTSFSLSGSFITSPSCIGPTRDLCTSEYEKSVFPFIVLTLLTLV